MPWEHRPSIRSGSTIRAQTFASPSIRHRQHTYIL